MSNPRPVGGRLISAAILFFAPLAVLCILLIVKRLVFGIGSVSNIGNLVATIVQSACGQADRIAGRRSDGYAAAVGNGFVARRISGGHAGYVQVRIQGQLCTAGYGSAGDVAVAFHVDGIAQLVVIATGSTAEIDAFGDVGRIIGNVLVCSMQLTAVHSFFAACSNSTVSYVTQSNRAACRTAYQVHLVARGAGGIT